MLRETDRTRKDIKMCLNCGAKLKYYHSADGVTRAVCEKKCQGWKVAEKIDRKKR